MPKPDPKQIDREFHKKTAAIYDARVDKKSKLYHMLFLYPYIDEVKRCLPGDKELLALDIGCGTGSVAIPLAEKGFSVVAVDHSPEMIEIARRKAADKGVIDKIRFVIGDAEKLDYPDDTFDLITCQGVMHHLTDRGPVLKEMRRVMRKSGYLYISEPVEIFSHFRILGFLGRVFHSLRREKDIEAPLLKDDFLRQIESVDGLSCDYFLVFYIPFLPLKLWESFRRAAVNFFKNKRVGSIVFVYCRR